MGGSTVNIGMIQIHDESEGVPAEELVNAAMHARHLLVIERLTYIVEDGDVDLIKKQCSCV